MQAYHNNPELKAQVLEQLAKHKAQDDFVKEIYWIGQKGCAIGCLTHEIGGGHELYPEKWGIPIELAFLEDYLFEGLSTEDSKEWPERFMNAIPIGADLSKVWAQFVLFLITDMTYGLQQKYNDKLIQYIIKYLNDFILDSNYLSLKSQIKSYIKGNSENFAHPAGWALRYIVSNEYFNFVAKASYYVALFYSRVGISEEIHYKWQADTLINIISQIKVEN